MPQSIPDDAASEPRRTRGRLTYVAVLLAGAVLVFAVLQGISWIFDAPGWGNAAWMAAVIVLIGAPLNAWVGASVTGRVRSHLATTDRLECSFRVVEGHQNGVTTRWRAGVATLSPGHVTFSHMVAGLRFFKRRPITFQVDVREVDSPRKLRGLEALMVTPDAQAIRLKSSSAVLEWAITPAERIPWVLERVKAR